MSQEEREDEEPRKAAFRTKIGGCRVFRVAEPQMSKRGFCTEGK